VVKGTHLAIKQVILRVILRNGCFTVASLLAVAGASLQAYPLSHTCIASNFRSSNERQHGLPGQWHCVTCKEPVQRQRPHRTWREKQRGARCHPNQVDPGAGMCTACENPV
jgi:hypothetical protein